MSEFQSSEALTSYFDTVVSEDTDGLTQVKEQFDGNGNAYYISRYLSAIEKDKEVNDDTSKLIKTARAIRAIEFAIAAALKGTAINDYELDYVLVRADQSIQRVIATNITGLGIVLEHQVGKKQIITDPASLNDLGDEIKRAALGNSMEDQDRISFRVKTADRHYHFLKPEIKIEQS